MTYRAAIAALALTGCLLDRTGTMSTSMDGSVVVDGASCTPAPELCDGVDNDCDPSTRDGADEPERCDATTDPDSCEDDQTVCSSTGERSCMNLTGAASELCDGVDNDCDPDTRDGAGEEAFGESCEGAGICGSGSVACVAGELACDAVSVEACNGHDDNCDAAIDESGCECARVLSTTGRRYLFCDQLLQSRTFNGARDACRGWGYELLSLETAEEHAFIASEASRRFNGAWWTGGNDQVAEGTFVWVATAAAFTYTNWAENEPNNFALSEDCVAIDTEVEGSNAKAGWADRGCVIPYRFVCEEAP